MILLRIVGLKLIPISLVNVIKKWVEDSNKLNAMIWTEIQRIDIIQEIIVKYLGPDVIKNFNNERLKLKVKQPSHPGDTLIPSPLGILTLPHWDTYPPTLENTYPLSLGHLPSLHDEYLPTLPGEYLPTLSGKYLVFCCE